MSAAFEELDYRPTRLGPLSLRRRKHLALGTDIYEIKLGEEFLMSSLFTVSEVALARLGLAELSEPSVDVVVGGLGLGCTARAVLDHAHVHSLVVIEALPEVIEWHEAGLLPLGAGLTADRRCRLVQGDFFAMIASATTGLDPERADRRFHAILVDIDHSPRHVLDPSHAALYEAEGLRRISKHLHPSGVFALWSNDPPDEQFGAILADVFVTSRAEVVSFHNPLQDRDATATIYVARTA
ncbi:MAG TPA: spermidine synthase [Stellaceae bacterium]|nr:spermidine synthase [Stellaceae bacterium]